MSSPTLQQLLLVGSGGFIGSVLRFLVSGWTHRLLPAATLPVGTLAVNLIGCLAIGFLGGLAEFRSLVGPQARLFLMIGVLGGFTTFSTFGHEGLGLLRDQQHYGAVLYIAGHVVLGLSAAWLGLILARSL
jgi:CrcB protein